jgi:myo-inositol-1-phosphate synthase
MKTIRTGIIGVGNCTSALVQGTHYYRERGGDTPGLITQDFCGYRAEDITFVSAFDIDERKIGRDLSQAVFADPNCTVEIYQDLPDLACPVSQGYMLDSVAGHMQSYPLERRYALAADPYTTRAKAMDAIVSVLTETGTEVVVNYLPVGSEAAAEFYAACCLKAGAALVNAMPVFLSQTMGDAFAAAGLPILGDDIKSQVGATILHRVLTRLFETRGTNIRHSYQINVGGNTDFLTMLERRRLESKKQSKTCAVTSQMSVPLSGENLFVGPSEYIPYLKDRKICFLRIEAEQYGGIPLDLDVRLSVEDSPNSAAVATDAIRAAKTALDRGLDGPVPEACAYLFKSPPVQYDDETARKLLLDFIGNNRACKQE